MKIQAINQGFTPVFQKRDKKANRAHRPDTFERQQPPVGSAQDIKQHITPLFSDKKIHRAIKKVAADINEYYGPKEELVLVGVLKGAAKFHAALAPHLNMPVKVQYITATSYAGTKSTGNVQLVNELKDVDGKNVLIVEDILDTGRTMKAIFADMKENYNAKSVKCVTLLNRTNASHTRDIEPDFNAIDLKSDDYIVGWWFDKDNYYRNLPYVGSYH